jgi:hypothetical protein
MVLPYKYQSLIFYWRNFIYDFDLLCRPLSEGYVIKVVIEVGQPI